MRNRGYLGSWKEKTIDSRYLNPHARRACQKAIKKRLLSQAFLCGYGIAVEEHFQEGRYHFRIEEDAGAGHNIPGYFIHILCFEIRGGIHHVVVVAGYGDDSGTQGDVYVFQMLRISGAVPSFVMTADVGEKVLAAGHRFQHIGSQLRMFLVKGELPSGKIGDFGQNVVGNGEESDVVKESGIADEGDFIGRKPHVYGGGAGVVGYPHGVVVEIF